MTAGCETNLFHICFFDQFYKTLDKQKTENTFLELGVGKKHCHLIFEKTGMEFDLCEKKQNNNINNKTKIKQEGDKK